MGIPVAGYVGLNASRCQFGQLFGMGKASNRGLSRVENVDGPHLGCEVPLLITVWFISCILVSHEVEMVRG